MSSLLNARGNSFIMYSIATHDRKSTLTSPIISDRFNSSCHGRFLFEYYTCNYKNIRKYICICLYYFFLCFVNLIADINEKSLPRWVSTFDGPPGSGFNELIFILRTVPGNTILQ